MKKLSLAAGLSVATLSLLGPALPAIADDVATGETSTETSTETVEAVPETFKQEYSRLIEETPGTEEQKATAREILAALPDDAPERAERFNAKLGVDHLTFGEIADSVINPDDYVCSTTPLTEWLIGTTSTWDHWDGLYYNMSAIREFPIWEAAIWGKESPTNTFGYNGEYTDLLNSNMKDLRRFWDIPTDIEFIPMHSKPIYENPERITEILKIVYGMNDADARYTARQLSNFVRYSPGLQRGAHPVLSFNAFAIDPADDQEMIDLGITKRIVVGDGVLLGMQSIGLDTKVAPRSIVAHEYGHHVQYVRNLFETDLTGPEATRRTELMADSFATYFMTHARGEALNAKRTIDGLKAFYNVGDCSFTSNGHHGTPLQRERASAWAVGLVEAQENQGFKLGSAKFAEKFEAVLPELVAPDAN